MGKRSGMDKGLYRVAGIGEEEMVTLVLRREGEVEGVTYTISVESTRVEVDILVERL